MRFSLRFLLVAVAVVAVVIAGALYFTEDYRKRRALESELLSMGARWAYIAEEGTIRVLFTEPVTNDFKKFGKVGQLEFKQLAVDANSLKAIAGLKYVGALMFTRCTFQDINDLAQVAKIGKVRVLLFWNTPIDDTAIPLIAKIPGLETVSLKTTKVTQAGIDQLQAARPEIRIDFRP